MVRLKFVRLCMVQWYRSTDPKQKLYNGHQIIHKFSLHMQDIWPFQIPSSWLCVQGGPCGIEFHINYQDVFDAAIPVAKSDRHKCVIACLPSVHSGCIIASACARDS